MKNQMLIINLDGVNSVSAAGFVLLSQEEPKGQVRKSSIPKLVPNQLNIFFILFLPYCQKLACDE